MSWDNITGESKILPGGTGLADEVRFESGKPKKVRILLADGEQPYSYLEHSIEAEYEENGQMIKTFRTIRCPKTTKNPNAHCPLCDGQQFKRRAKNAANVWDYDLNKVQKLNAGDGIWKPIATTRKLGVDVLNLDWGLMKTGSTRNDIEYTATNLGQTNFTLPADAVLFDIEQEYAPHTVDEMRYTIESLGLDWDTVINPPQLQYPSLNDALEHVMPNGRYKGQTFKQIWDADPTSKGMINFLAIKSDRITDEKAAAQVILVNLGGANIEGVPKDGKAQKSTAKPSTKTTTSVESAKPKVDNERNKKIEEINKLLSTSEKFVKGGFEVIIDTMKQASGGKTNIVDFTDEELDKMVKLCK